MSYSIKTNFSAKQAEDKLPQGKLPHFRIILILSLFSTQAFASKVNFEEKINTYLQKEIDSYLATISSSNQKQEIELFIPRGSKNLSCDDLQISRSKKDTPPAGRISLSVECSSPKWRFRASAKIKLWVRLVAAKRNISRGEVLTADLLEYKSVDIGKHLHSVEAHINKLIGMTVKREVSKNDIISRRYLENKQLVNKDEYVLLQVNTASFSANVKAIALQDGQLGEIIKVKNLSSDKVVQGRVIDVRVVEAIL